MQGASPRLKALEVLPFAVAIFASAFLIFAVQPMVGKHILPWFGGVPAVWMTCLAFYQATLFLGYAYAYWLVRRVSPAHQPRVQALVFVAALAVLPVLPGAEWRPGEAGDATARILAMLAANVALPFLLLASTGPLLQVWFAQALPGRSPYPLYAVSNLGSLLGLVSFPFLVEPTLALSFQSRLWSWSFAFTGIAILGCAWWAAARGGADTAGAGGAAADAATRRGDRVLWVLFPAAGVVMFMGVTNHLCLDVASIPFLWIVPLSIYLLTLILCFGSERLYRRGLVMGLAVLSLLGVVLETEWDLGPRFGLAMADSVGRRIVLYSVALFFGCMVAHGELYRLRPAASRLAAFYLCVAGGGALGGLFVGILAPRIFLGYHELPIGATACWLMATVASWRDPSAALRGRWRRLAHAAMALVGVAALGSYSLRAGQFEPGTALVGRSFFGILRVIERGTNMPYMVLRHGTTKHGVQYRSPELRVLPTSYFGRITGIGLVLADESSEPAPRRIGIVGLGIGTLAAYGRPGDRIVFYEIDPDVVRIARDSRFFHYLEDSKAEVEVVVGDARLSLEEELRSRGSREFDVLVLDAFTGDSIPLHLLTYEAFQLYDGHLRKGGVLAAHISNRTLNLAPQVARLGQTLGMRASIVRNQSAREHLSAQSDWLVLSRDPGYHSALASRAASFGEHGGRSVVAARRPVPQRLARVAVWTDDYSNLFSLLAARWRSTDR